jgi:hypothetical protein
MRGSWWRESGLLSVQCVDLARKTIWSGLEPAPLSFAWR